MINKSLNYEFSDTLDLQKSLMPFVNGQSLFIPSQESFHLSEEVKLTLAVSNVPKKLDLLAKIIWITPNPGKIMWFNASNTSGEDMTPGVGVWFIGAESKAFSAWLEQCLPNGIDPNIKHRTL